MIVKAISLWEPWASLMRRGAKTIETRSWYTSHRGPLLICAALYWSRELDALLAQSLFQGALLAPDRRIVSRDDMLFGQAVCLVDLADCVSTHTVRDQVNAMDRAFGDFSNGRLAWVTRNLRVLDPFPVHGRQGLFNVEIPDRLLPAAAVSR